MSGTNTSAQSAASFSASPSAYQDNPYFRVASRAPYELGHLLQLLPVGGSSKSASDTSLLVEAAAAHAHNANYALLNGLEALGNLLVVAGMHKENELAAQDMGSLGALITHIAVEAQFLQELGDELGTIRRKQASFGKEGQ